VPLQKNGSSSAAFEAEAAAAGRKEIIIACAKRIDRCNDLGRDIGNDPRLAQIIPDFGEITGDIADILLLRAPGKYLVADDEERRRHGWSLRHDRSPRRLLA
jgi:hypothetical protein